MAIYSKLPTHRVFSTSVVVVSTARGGTARSTVPVLFTPIKAGLKSASQKSKTTWTENSVGITGDDGVFQHFSLGDANSVTFDTVVIVALTFGFRFWHAKWVTLFTVRPGLISTRGYDKSRRAGGNRVYMTDNSFTGHKSDITE